MSIRNNIAHSIFAVYDVNNISRQWIMDCGWRVLYEKRA